MMYSICQKFIARRAHGRSGSRSAVLAGYKGFVSGRERHFCVALASIPKLFIKASTTQEIPSKPASARESRYQEGSNSDDEERLQFNGGRFLQRLNTSAHPLLCCVARSKVGGKAETLTNVTFLQCILQRWLINCMTSIKHLEKLCSMVFLSSTRDSSTAVRG